MHVRDAGSVLDGRDDVHELVDQVIAECLAHAAWRPRDGPNRIESGFEPSHKICGNLWREAPVNGFHQSRPYSGVRDRLEGGLIFFMRMSRLRSAPTLARLICST
jgi:hypothetical protein